MAKKILLWFMFSVIIALLPIVFNFLKIIISKDLNLTFYILVSKGELFLLSACITAASIGELLISKNKWTIGKIISGGGCLCILMLSSFLFAYISSADTLGEEFVIETYNVLTIIIFTAAIITSGFSIALSEISKKYSERISDVRLRGYILSEIQSQLDNKESLQ